MARGLSLFFMLAAGVTLGCNPDLPDRSCDSAEDCFSEERCVNARCVPRSEAVYPDGAASAPDAEGGPEADAGAPDGAPDGDLGDAGDEAEPG